MILEPDSLGIIPYNTTIYGAEEWCRPTVIAEDGSVVPAPGASPEERYAQLQYAASTFRPERRTRRLPRWNHSAWLGVGEAASASTRQVRSGDGRELAHGFYLNASNYQTTAERRSSAPGFRCVRRSPPIPRKAAGASATSAGARASTIRLLASRWTIAPNMRRPSLRGFRA